MATSFVNIPNIKDQVKSLLDTNNTTTSSLHDLSANMTTRVQQVLTVNPEKIPIGADIMPAVTIFVDRKDIDNLDIAVNQLKSKRKAEVTFTVAGMLYNQNFIDDIYDDPADQDCEYLAENIEAVLRNYDQLNDSVTWHGPDNVTYHAAQFDEQSHMRICLIDFIATCWY